MTASAGSMTTQRPGQATQASFVSKVVDEHGYRPSGDLPDLLGVDPVVVVGEQDPQARDIKA